MSKNYKVLILAILMSILFCCPLSVFADVNAGASVSTQTFQGQSNDAKQSMDFTMIGEPTRIIHQAPYITFPGFLQTFGMEGKGSDFISAIQYLNEVRVYNNESLDLMTSDNSWLWFGGVKAKFSPVVKMSEEDNIVVVFRPLDKKLKASYIGAGSAIATNVDNISPGVAGEMLKKAKLNGCNVALVLLEGVEDVNTAKSFGLGAQYSIGDINPAGDRSTVATLGASAATAKSRQEKVPYLIVKGFNISKADLKKLQEIADEDQNKLDQEARDQQAAEAAKAEGLNITIKNNTSQMYATIYFNLNSYAIRYDQVQTLNKIIAYLQKNQKASIKIDGHCSIEGSKEYNDELGLKRAKTVKNYLVKRDPKIAAQIDSLTSYGKEAPVSTNQELNRRVEVSPAKR